MFYYEGKGDFLPNMNLKVMFFITDTPTLCIQVAVGENISYLTFSRPCQTMIKLKRAPSRTSESMYEDF